MNKRQRLLALTGKPDPVRARDDCGHGRRILAPAS
jgi:hypothetical protein